MRKLLLTSTVMLGASLGMAHASMFQSTADAGSWYVPPVAKLSPGQIVVHIDLRTNVYFGVAGSSANNVAGNKQSAVGMVGYNRMYFGADGLAANGLKYGLSLEVRQNFGSPLGTGFGAGASGNSTNSTLYVRRDYVYMGTDQLGTFRFGQTDGPATLFLLGTFEGFNDGGWNGDVPAMVPGAVQPVWAWSDVGNMYTTGKIEYLSPNLAGFDFGISFAPSQAGIQDGGGCTAAYTGCAMQSSVAAGAAGIAQAKNTVEVAGRYRGNFAGFGVAASAGYYGSGYVTNSSGPNKYDGLSVGEFGLELSYAGVTVGGNVEGGQMNGQWGLMPKGGKQGVAWIAGAQYTTGPVVIGASYFNYQDQGTFGVGTQRSNTGIAAGGTYAIAPGLVAYLSYLYGDIRQGGVNLLTGATGTVSNNEVHSQVITLGTRFMW